MNKNFYFQNNILRWKTVPKCLVPVGKDLNFWFLIIFYNTQISLKRTRLY